MLMEFARVNRKRENRVLATVERRGGQLFMPNIGPSKSQATQRESTELEEYNMGDRVSNPVHFQTFLRKDERESGSDDVEFCEIYSKITDTSTKGKNESRESVHFSSVNDNSWDHMK